MNLRNNVLFYIFLLERRGIMKVCPVLLMGVLWLLPAAEFGLAAGKEKAVPDHAETRNREIARIDGQGILLNDLPYDPESRYHVELQAMKVRLYQEQRAVLQQHLDQRLLEKEAAKRNLTTDSLITVIRARAEETAKAFEDDKDVLFQEFVKKMQRDFPAFSRRTAAMTASDPAEGFSLPPNGADTPFIDEVKNKVVEMQKTAYVNAAKEAFIRQLRAQSRIEIFLERPRLISLDLTPDDDEPWLGSKDAPITIQVFIDFQCPYCKTAISTLKDLLAKKKENIRIVARDFPLPSHPDAAMAARAAACADDQDCYWEYHDLLFDNQQKLDVTSLRGYAAALGLDTTRFDRCLEDGSGKAEVEKDMTEAALAGINSTPGIIINGFYLSGNPSLNYLEEVVRDIEQGHAPRVDDVPGNG